MPQKPQKLVPFDAEKVLREIRDIRRRIPDLEEATAARARSENTFDAYATGELSRVSGEAAEELMTEFDYLAVARAFQELAEDLGAEIERKRREVHDQCLEVYYAAIDLLEKGDTSVLPHVEAMERAYRADYGKDIPPKNRQRQ